MADLIALVPEKIGQSFDDAPPGHRYRLYLQFWQHNFAPTQKEKLQALKPACKLPEHTKKLMQALAKRSVTEESATTHCIEAKSTSPFATGLGWEHPNENGFAFLDPYGLPYLPGSGVKGVMRLAAEQLALEPPLPPGEGRGEGNLQWNMADVWLMFGFDANSAIFDHSSDNSMREAWLDRREQLIDEPALQQFIQASKPGHAPREFLENLEKPGFRNEIHTQGCLRFWDVIPELADSKMEVDILNPHYGDYYHNGRTPHDAGQPIPVFFLTVPPGSTFCFRVDLLAPQRLGERQKESWKCLLKAAFDHAFDWLGFGAKTSVGYGAIQIDKEAQAKRERDAAEQAEKRHRESMSPIQQKIEDFRKESTERAEQLGNSKEKQNTGIHQHAQRLTKEARESSEWTPEEKRELAEIALEWLPQLVERWDKDAAKKLKLADLKGQS